MDTCAWCGGTQWIRVGDAWCGGVWLCATPGCGHEQVFVEDPNIRPVCVYHRPPAP